LLDNADSAMRCQQSDSEIDALPKFSELGM